MRRQLACAPRIAGGLAAERGGDLADEGAGAVQDQPAPSAGRRELGQPSLDPRRRLRADPGDAVEPPGAAASRSSGSVLIPSACPSSRIRFAERPSSRATPDELRQRLRLQLVELGDPAGLDELSEAPLDARADSGQLARPPCAHERRHVRGRRADQLRRTPVCAHGVRAGAVQLEQGGERLEALGEGGVVHD